MSHTSNQCDSFGKLPSPPFGFIGWPWAVETQQLSDTMPDGRMWPKISVVTPSYNQGQFIEETIRSVLLQDYPNLEFIVIDGGSTDNSVEIIKKYETWLAYWVSEPDKGQSHAINKGIRQASGDILLWLNSDDLCLPGAFRLAAQAFHTHPDSHLVVGQARMIDDQGRVIGELCSHFTSWDELVTNPRNSVRQISTFFSRSLFNELGLIDESLHIAMDMELLVRFTQHHSPLILDDYMTAYRVHPQAKTYSQILRGYEEVDRVRPKYLQNRTITAIYHKRSSSNWLSLSESDDYSLSDRIKCLLRAIHHRPALCFNRGFWSSLKKVGSRFLQETITNKDT